MNTLELIDKKEQLLNQANQIINKAETEVRELNESENTEFNTIKEEVRAIENQIQEIESLTKSAKGTLETKSNTRNMEKFSLLKAINDIANNRQLDERALEVVNKGMAEMRKSGQSYSGLIVLPIEERAEIKATVASAGQEIVAEDKLNILAPLRAKNVLVQAGATWLSGLVGNVSIPAYSGSNVAWAGETAAAADGAGSFSEVNLEPKRLTAYLDISKQFLIQDSLSAEAMLRNDIINAISNKLESTILGTTAGSATQPAGMFNAITAETAEMNYKGLVGMETTLESANVTGNRCFIVSPTAKADLKTTLKAANTASYLMEGNEIIGYQTYVTTNVAGKGVVMGCFEDYVIGQWGAIDLTVDPFTQAPNGKIRLVINAYFDAKPRRAESFVKKVLKA